VRGEPVTDPLDPRLADYRMAREANHRARGVFLAEGRFAVRQLLGHSPFAARSVLTTAAMLGGLSDLLESRAASVPTLIASPQVIRTVVGFAFHRGCLAVGERGRSPSAAELVEPPGPRTLVALEKLVDPENVGAVFRNALAFGVHAVLLSPGCGDPLARKAIRASAGGTLRVPFAVVDDWPRGLTALTARGYQLIALSPAAARELGDLPDPPPPERRALLLGNEGHGLSAGSLALAAAAWRIAMAPGVDSLNVATASGIALHRLRRAGAAAPGA
jgi:tRNA G18 (ribose-2'-O)-methylase SpoU